MSNVNSHNEEIFRDGEPRESSPGFCDGCHMDRKICKGCGCWLACENCQEGPDCECAGEATVEASADDEEETASIPAESMQSLVFGATNRKAA